ncbi:MAG: 16S rRNA (adenine(1518)-N(6)/adenine(1519)-N(6))-dimethyltransferase RsmA [Acutalibacteraceae bacterium]
MNALSNIGNIKEIFARHGFTFSKALGQNFLINPSVCPRMAQECGADAQTGVLEVGPGIGVLTVELAARAKKVVSVELDDRLLPMLRETLAEHPNASVVHGDILKLDLHELIAREFCGMDVAVCANLPYYITSPVIMRFLEERLPIRALTVMVQKEAADRICALPGQRAAGALSLAVRYYARPEILFQVSRGSFLPAPNVDSTVIRLNVLSQPPVSVDSEQTFFALVRASFGQRRKTLCNAVSAGMGIPKETLSALLTAAEIPPQARAEQLSLEQFAHLSNEISKQKGENNYAR